MSKSKGDEAEKKALLLLKDKKFEIIETNFYAKKLGEIDIIAKKDEVYHFLEVKSANDYESAILNLFLYWCYSCNKKWDKNYWEYNNIIKIYLILLILVFR